MLQCVRRASTTAVSTDRLKFKIVVLGAGSGGLSVANQIHDRFKAAGKALSHDDIAIVDPAEYHYYQPGWTLVGSGLASKNEFRRPLPTLIPPSITHIPEKVDTFSPASSSITTTSGRTLSYDALVVATGLQINWHNIGGLSKALADPTSGVSSIYSADTCDKVYQDLSALRSGRAIFTQPAGVVKCAGAPQKIMWMAWDNYRRSGRLDTINVDFYTGMPTMFSVKKYSDALDQLRAARDVGGYFEHNLLSVDPANHKATFKKSDGTTVDRDYTILHVTPPMGPLDAIKNSPLADSVGWVNVDQGTLQHVNPEFKNVFALGDCSSLPTSKTAAAITGQAPVLTENLFSLIDTGAISENARYDGYTSCPLLTGYGQLMLAEFKYGAVPKETFSQYFDQTKPNRFFYHLKKDVFPVAYWNYMVKGKWFGTAGLSRPTFS